MITFPLYMSTYTNCNIVSWAYQPTATNYLNFISHKYKQKYYTMLFWWIYLIILDCLVNRAITGWIYRCLLLQRQWLILNPHTHVYAMNCCHYIGSGPRVSVQHTNNTDDVQYRVYLAPRAMERTSWVVVPVLYNNINSTHTHNVSNMWRMPPEQW